ncbi:hypothetical protein [Actinopolymorpha pittospori]|uniref:Uncharacterized protein n=1 Tax=Actinopolymorpha pittospori TaxID=648752 RepID=A0A927RHK6_9ACTN|nr:hypothetical protein [Actinopolymorpha pittospori]MBE1612315.1 hypothetical protein [Actinopolymorpha pittospori]
MTAEALVEAVESVRRLGRAAILARALVAVSGFVALALVLPPGLSGPLPYVVSALLALVPAVVPGTWLVMALELLVMFGWLLRTTAFEVPVSWLPLVALAWVAYLHHAGSALAAALPLDAVVTGSVLRRFLVRALAMLAAVAVTGAVAVGIAGRLAEAPTVVVPVVGVLLALGLVGVLVYDRIPRRRR